MGRAEQANEASAVRVQWRLLGEVTAVIDDDHEVQLGGRQRAVLALLLLGANTSVSVDEIADGLWAENLPKTARNSVQRFVADIRRSLGSASERLTTTASGYLLQVEPGELDVGRARDLLERGRAELNSGRVQSALSLLEAGTKECRSAPLQGIRSEALHRDAVGPLNELRTNLRASRFEAALAAGQHTEIGDDLQQFAHENPASEHAWALYMLGLYRSGRQRAALEAGEQLRACLVGEHGITPSPRIAKLVHQILNHADELQLTPLEPVAQGGATKAQRSQARRSLPPQLTRAIVGPLAGRDPALEYGDDVIEALISHGSPAVTLVAGEPGVGKTRLAAEFASMAAAAGSAVLYGRSDEDTAVPLGCWTEVLTEIAVTHRDAIDQVVRGPARESLGAILPHFAPDMATHSSEQLFEATSDLRRATLFQTISTLLAQVGSQQPLTVVLDDLQWADVSTLQLLRHVARHLTQPVWIIGIYRDNELSDEHPLQEVIAALVREPHVHPVPLKGIDEAGVTALVQSLVPGVNEARLPEFAHALQRETRGNPFFAAEIVRNLVESAPDERTLQLTEPDGGARALPDSVRQVIGQRVRRLGDETATALRCASVFGREFELGELAQLLGSPEERVLDMLEAGCDANIVSELTGRPDRFSFAHDLMQHCLYSDLSESRRRRLHRRIAEIVSATVSATQLDSRASEIAGHFLSAGAARSANQTIRAVDHAATVAARRHAPQEAASLLGRGLHALADPTFVAGLGPDTDIGLLRMHMLVKQGLELRNAGNPDYRQALLDAGQAARELGDIEAEVEAALANTRGHQTNVYEIDTARVEQLKSAISALGDEESARRANLLASLASEQWADRDRHESKQLRLESLELARRVGHPETLANVLARAARARNADTSTAEYRELADEMRALLPQSDQFDPYLVVNVLRTLQNQALRDADASLLRDTTKSIRALTERTQLPSCQRANVLSEVLTAGIQGQAERHLQLAEQALALSLEMGDPESFIVYEGHYFLGMAMLGRTAEILPMALQVAQDRSDQDIYRATASSASFMSGDFASAHELVEQQLALGFRPAVDDYTIQAVQLWADSAAATDHGPACEELYRLLAPHAGRLSGHVILVTQPVDLSLGRLCRVLGRYDDAFAHFDVADRICRDFNATWMQGLTDISRAETLIARNQPGDSTAASQLVQAALARARTHNHDSIVQAADRLAAKGSACP